MRITIDLDEGTCVSSRNLLKALIVLSKHSAGIPEVRKTRACRLNHPKADVAGEDQTLLPAPSGKEKLIPIVVSDR
jgi:hypothetical protein